MILGGVATLLQMLANGLSGIPFVGLVVGALAQIVAWAAYVFLQYTILVVQATAAIPFGSFEVARIDTPLVILFYAVLFGVTYLGIRRTGQVLVSRLWVGIGVLALATMFVWTTALASPDPRTRLSFIAASEGDATFIRTGDDYRIRINGTGEPGTLLSFLGSQFPPWDRRLDVVIATHLDNENLASLNAVLERYSIAQVLEPPAPSRPGVSYAKWRGLVDKNKIAAIPAVQGTTLQAGETTLDVIYPPPDVDSTYAALRLTTNEKTFLLAPALRKLDRQEILKHDVLFDADVAVLSNEVEKELLEQVTPETVLLFVGRRPQDKPSIESLKLFDGATVLRTDERGNIEHILDGENAAVQSQR